MDKLKMAHDWAMRNYAQFSSMTEFSSFAWQYADAMQAEAEKRNKAEAAQKRKEIREILNDAKTFIERERQHFDDVESLCEVDWSKAPSGAMAYIKLSVWDVGAWIDGLGFQIENAPSFGFTGTHIMERPHGF